MTDADDDVRKKPWRGLLSGLRPSRGDVAYGRGDRRRRVCKLPTLSGRSASVSSGCQTDLVPS